MGTEFSEMLIEIYIFSSKKMQLKLKSAWWPHQMETFSALLALCAGNSSVTDEFPAQRPVTWSFEVFFDLRLKKQLSKPSWGWWRHHAHYDVTVMKKLVAILSRPQYVKDYQVLPQLFRHYLLWKLKFLSNFLCEISVDNTVITLPWHDTETKLSSFWQNCHHWLHQKLLSEQLSLLVMTKFSKTWP